MKASSAATSLPAQSLFEDRESQPHRSEAPDWLPHWFEETIHLVHPLRSHEWRTPQFDSEALSSLLCHHLQHRKVSWGRAVEVLRKGWGPRLNRSSFTILQFTSTIALRPSFHHGDPWDRPDLLRRQSIHLNKKGNRKHLQELQLPVRSKGRDSKEPRDLHSWLRTLSDFLCHQYPRTLVVDQPWR